MNHNYRRIIGPPDRIMAGYRYKCDRCGHSTLSPSFSDECEGKRTEEPWRKLFPGMLKVKKVRILETKDAAMANKSEECTCAGWTTNTPKLNAVCLISAVHGQQYDGNEFKHCPWCGSKLQIKPVAAPPSPSIT